MDGGIAGEKNFSKNRTPHVGIHRDSSKRNDYQAMNIHLTNILTTLRYKLV